MRSVSGFLISMMLACGGAHAASFDCAAAASPDEHAVCDSPRLSRLDDDLSIAYANARVAAPSRGMEDGDVRRIARDFLAARHACRQDASCIRDAYVEVLDRFRAVSGEENREADDIGDDSVEGRDTPPDHASPSVCVVILGLTRQAIADGRARGDDGPLRRGSEIFRAKSVELHEGDDTQAQQMIASTLPFYDNLTPAQLSRAADLCLSAIDENFAEDN